MNKNFRQSLILIAFGVILFVGLMNLRYVASFLIYVIMLILPVFAGLMLAFVLNVLVSGMEKLLTKAFSKRKHKPSELTITRISAAVTIIAIVSVLILIINLAGPEIVYSVKSVYFLIQEKWPVWEEKLRGYNIDISIIAGWFKATDISALADRITSGTGAVLDTIIGAAASTISGLVTAGIAFVIAIYVLFSKKELGGQVKRLMDAYCSDKVSNVILKISRLSQETYAKFLSGQFVEAIILGMLMFIAFSIFKLPYAALTAVVTAVFAFIPYIGAFSACVFAAVLTLIADPSKFIICIIVYNVVQFIENQFIYPHVVGSSVGLSALWTLVAALIGGKLLGLVGIIFFIPLTAVISTLLHDEVDKRIEMKKSRAKSHESEV